MVEDALKELGKKAGDFNEIWVFGDRRDDAGLAERLGAKFIDVRGKTLRDLQRAYDSLKKPSA